MPRSRLPPKLKSVDKLEAFLTFLSNNPNRYVPRGDIEKALKDKFDNNVIAYALGLNDRVAPPNRSGIPDPNARQTASYLADIAQIRQTKLIDVKMVYLDYPRSRTQQDGYILTGKGIEVLNQLQLKRSSQNLEFLTMILIIGTILLVIIAYPNFVATTCSTYYKDQTMLSGCNNIGAITEIVMLILLVFTVVWKIFLKK